MSLWVSRDTEHRAVLIIFTLFFKIIFIAQLLASCLINVQPLPAHRPAADDNSLIGCTRPRPDRWLVAAYAHFVDSLCPFWCSFGCIPFIESDVLKTMYRSDNTTPIYLINVLWKLGLEFRLDLELHYFSIFHGEYRNRAPYLPWILWMVTSC